MKSTTATTLRNLLLALAGAAILASSAWSQTASLTRDINTRAEEPASSFPAQMLAVGDKLFFAASQEGSGRELWVSDGSGVGTQMLGDLCPGACDASPVLLGGTGGVLLFAVNVPNAQGRGEIWRSDGTRKGTFALRSAGSEPIYFSEPSFSVSGAVPLAGALLFSGCTPDFKCQLWKSNGTPEGTQPLQEVFVSELAASGGKAYFLSDIALWVSDGTAAGTQTVRQFPSSPRFLTPAGNRVFFVVTDDQGDELWTSDGTAAGTRALTSFPNDRPFEDTQGLKAIGNHVYFVADDVIHGSEIWRSDGTPETTRRITEFGFHAPLNNDTILSQMEEIGNRLLFVATDGLTPTRLWTTAGPPESTAPLPCVGGCPELSTERMIKVGGRVLFVGSDNVHGRELWSTDGTAAGTMLIKDICPGLCDGLNADLVPFPGTSFFIATIDQLFSPSSFELWTSDGTAAGTRRFADPASGFQSPQNDSIEIAALGPNLFFPGRNGYGQELWASDGKPGGTRLVTDLARSGPGSDPQDLVALSGQLLFTACDGNYRNLWTSSGTPDTTAPVTAGNSPGCFSSGNPYKLTVAGPWVYYWLGQSPSTLWRTDGTAAGTLQLADFQSGGTDLLALGGRVFFTLPATSDSTRWEMWQSDGTPAGTRKVFELPPDAGQPESLTALGTEMYFIARQDFDHPNLWRSDGTLAGTRRLTDGLHFQSFPHFTRVGSSVFFAALDVDNGFTPELWKTDGTSAGTVRVRGGFGGTNDLSEFTAFDETLYFVARDFFPRNRSLWRSDGTEAGTVPVLAFSGEDPSDSTPFGLTILGDRLYFAADDGIHGRELWRSDGTTAGTTLVRDIRSGPSGSQPTGLTAAGGRLFFSALDADHGFEPWQSDGTEAGTRLLQDLAPWGASSYPELFTAAGGKLYFTADDRLHGSELWALPLTGSGGCQPSATSLCLNGGRYKVEADWRDFQGNTGAGQAVALTADTGYFWFFAPANVEVILKVLDGRALNDHVWVFFGALSNVEYTLTVTDTATGVTRRYFNPAGTFGSLGDTRGFGPLGAYSTADQSTAKTLLPLVAERTAAAAVTSVCVPGAARLCLNDGRFAVEATWKDFGGRTGSGTAVPLTADTGYFWFFNAANVEVVLKVLDGQPVNGRFWVFYGALSNVEYTLTVTDTLTGHIRTYMNPSGRFASIGDTQAF
ncbi:MAG TPA: ELWxxDGT repeat protein [Thermoanaerobaculia bacterium]|nr:ELWxxDGT repeat protein [Thermoanaerobaculia bacterium]